MRHRAAIAAAVLLGAACSREGALTARWGTTDSAAVALSATARWCSDAGRIDLRARSGDTAFGVALYPTDSVAVAVSYPVWVPGQPVAYRPGAGVAVRWLGKASIEGWWGDSGAVEVTGDWRRLEGHGVVRLVSGNGPDSTLPLEFSFRDVSLVADSLCDQRVLPPGVPNVSDSTGTPAAGGVD